MNAKEHARKMLVKRNHPLFEAVPEKTASAEKVVVQKKEATNASQSVTNSKSVEPENEANTSVKKVTKKKVKDDQGTNLDD